MLGCPLFDPTTGYLSECSEKLTLAGLLVGAALTLTSELLPLLKTPRIESRVKSSEVFSFILSLVVFVLWMSVPILLDISPSWTDWIIICSFAYASLGHYIQAGRVRITCGGLLLYWLFSSLMSVSLLVNSYLRADYILLKIYAGIAALSAILLFTESSPRAHVHGDSAKELLYEGRNYRCFDATTLFDRISMGFVTPMMKKGKKEKLSRSDMPRPPSELNAVSIHERLQCALDKFTGSKYRVLFALLYALKWELTIMLLVDIIAEFIWLFEPALLSTTFRLLQDHVDGKAPLFPALYFGVLFGLFPLFEGALFKISQLYQGYADVVARASVTGVIYRKSLNLAPVARESFDTSKIVNLVNVDTNFILMLSDVIIIMVTCPLMLLLAIWQLWILVGPPVAGGAVVLGFFALFTGYTSKLSMPLYPAWMEAADERTKATTNLLRNIKSLKLYAWERPYHERVKRMHNEVELPKLRDFLRITAVNNGVWAVSDDLVAIFVFLAYLWWERGALTPDIVFPTLSLLTIVSIQAGTLPAVITQLMQLLTANQRITDLLSQPEQNYVNYYRSMAQPGEKPGSIEMRDVTISWNDSEEATALRDLNVHASTGDFVCVTGRVGAGKTALLKAIVGELCVKAGSVSVIGSLAYCTQDPWLQNGTLRENIVFGQTYEEEWYNEVILACSLTKDVEQMPKGHETEVGERGIGLSGGQKARVALARAVYSRADIYILDDVLSAVDEHVAKYLVDHLFSKDGILSHHTVILATNYVKVLAHASVILAIQDKAVVEQTTIESMLQRREHSITYRLIKEFGTGSIDSVEIYDRKEHVRSREASALSSQAPSRADTDNVSDGISKMNKTLPLVILPGDQLALSDERRTDEENADESKKTSSSLAVYGRYLSVIPKWELVTGFGVTILSVMCMNSISVWLGVISSHRFTSLGPAEWYIGVYMAITVLSSFLSMGGFLWFLGVLSIQAAKHFHSRMLWRVMHAPMTFFDVTPLGRVINRFTGDINQLDTSLPQGMYLFLRHLINVALLAVYVIAATPLTVIVFIPLGLLVQYYRLLYVPTSRQVSRLVKATNSPLLSQIEETLKGATLVRGFSRIKQYIELYDARQNHWIEMRFLQRQLQGWLQWRIQCLSTALRVTAIVSSIMLVSHGRLSVASVGVVIQFVNKIGMIVSSIISQIANLEVAAVALDRIVEYIDIEQEAPAVISANTPDESWPDMGAVLFGEYSCRYKADGPDVLKKLSLKIKPGERIGIVGRTGSGKSTLTLALFRLIEASAGSIQIDDIDTSTLGLYDLRSHLSIIPQDAQIFSGTVRENLDPLDTADDARLWRILELCHLKGHFESLQGLDTVLTDGGDNLSRGQAQLVCLGRALLHEGKILVLDEATASVDVETDWVLQQTIRTEFKSRTILTVAHRLNTIMDSDRILVLDHGSVAEFDTPDALLAKKGMFYSLVNAEKRGDLEM